jgi:cation transporter-like permease
MARVPTPQEFARIFRRMDLPTRARLSTKVWDGEVSDDPKEAALVAAAARREWRSGRWMIWMCGILSLFQVVVFFTVESDVVRWSSVAVIIFSFIGIVVALGRMSSLRTTERLNRERAEATT